MEKECGYLDKAGYVWMVSDLTKDVSECYRQITRHNAEVEIPPRFTRRNDMPTCLILMAYWMLLP